MPRPLHADFAALLEQKPSELTELFLGLREFILDLYPEANEIFYHTQALTSVFSLSDKLVHGFVHLPIYRKHMNLGFNQGALLPDPVKLLQGSGKLIRHLPIKQQQDYQRPEVQTLILDAIALSHTQFKGPSRVTGMSISKIK